MQSSIYQRASRLHALYTELRALLAAEHGDEWLKHIDPIVKALTPPFESEEQCDATINEAKHRFNAILAPKGGFAEFYVHRKEPSLRVSANQRLEQLKELLCEC
jgi:hypothetical protein